MYSRTSGRKRKKKNTKNSNQIDQSIAFALALELEEYAKKHNFSSNIKYSIYKEGQEYKIKILSDNENILGKYLEEMEK